VNSRRKEAEALSRFLRSIGVPREVCDRITRPSKRAKQPDLGSGPIDAVGWELFRPEAEAIFKRYGIPITDSKVFAFLALGFGDALKRQASPRKKLASWMLHQWQVGQTEFDIWNDPAKEIFDRAKQAGLADITPRTVEHAREDIRGITPWRFR
jgi:hypothetical protein